MVKRNEHDYIRIGNDIKTGRIPGLVILQGIEEYLVHFYTQQLIDKFVNSATKSLDLVELDRDTVTVDQIIESVETVSLLSERKVVVIRDFLDYKGRYPKNMQKGESQFKAFCDYVCGEGGSSGIPDGALLILTISKQDENDFARNKMIEGFGKTFAKVGNVYNFEPLNYGQLKGFIEKRFRASGKGYRPSLIGRIADESGYANKNVDYGLYELNNDLQKIIAHNGSNEMITDDDVVGVVTSNPENDVFGMLDAIGSNRKDRALELLHNVLENGGNEYQVLGLLTGQLEIMLMTKELAEEGVSIAKMKSELRSSLGINEYRTEKAYMGTKNFSAKALRRMLSSAYDIDMQIKSGLYDGKLALELFIAGV